jgi:hypothetical protein
MEKTPESFLYRLMILIPIKFFLGSIIFLFKDKLIGTGLLIAAIIAFIWCVLLAYKIKRKYVLNALRSSAYLHIIIGTIMFALGLTIFILEGTEKYLIVLFKFGIGTLLVSAGAYALFGKHNSKN